MAEHAIQIGKIIEVNNLIVDKRIARMRKQP